MRAYLEYLRDPQEEKIGSTAYSWLIVKSARDIADLLRRATAWNVPPVLLQEELEQCLTGSHPKNVRRLQERYEEDEARTVMDLARVLADFEAAAEGADSDRTRRLADKLDGLLPEKSRWRDYVRMMSAGLVKKDEN